MVLEGLHPPHIEGARLTLEEREGLLARVSVPRGRTRKMSANS